VTIAGEHVLDNVAWNALTGPHARFADRLGRAVRYDTDVAPFAAIEDRADPRSWRDLAELAGPGATVVVPGVGPNPPDGWAVTGDVAGVQLVATDALTGAEDVEAEPLGPADVPEMLDLVERTKPGPFRKRTVELGTYLGIRRDGVLIAMAGERLRLPGWTELSAVCTDPAYRGEGLAGRLVRTLVSGVRRRGDTPFLHTGEHNTTAISLYETLGFTLRTKLRFRAFEIPSQRR
jgi:ribosomal protein S18 acetylase RimI-like enzyme